MQIINNVYILYIVKTAIYHDNDETKLKFQTV